MKISEMFIAIMLFSIISMQFVQVLVVEDDLDKLEDRIGQNIMYITTDDN